MKPIDAPDALAHANPVGRPIRVGPFPIRTWLLLAGCCLAVYGIGLGGDRVVTSHEMDVAGGARQMIVGGDWLIPRIGDHPWLEKPPLLHWLVAALMMILGTSSEWVTRLPSAVAGTGVVMVVAFTVGRWKGERAGLAAGLIQCTSYYMIAYALLAEADMLLAFMVVSAIAVFIHLQGIGLPAPGRRPGRWAASFWLIIGLTNLCKGPLFGAAMALMPCLAWLLWQREAAAWRRLWSPAGLAAALFVAAAWPVAVVIKEPSTLDLWLSHTLGRAMGDIGYGKPWWYYLTTVPWQLLPWAPATLIGVIPSLKRMWSAPRSADGFAWLWALAPIVALSFSHGKHHHYLISCLPGFTLVTTTGLIGIGQRIRQRAPDSVAIGWACAVILAPAAAMAALVVGIYRPEYRIEAWVLGAVCAAGALGAGTATLKGRDGRAFAALMVAVIAAVGYIYLQVIPAADDRREDRRFLTTLHDYLPPEAVLFTTGGPGIVRDIYYVQAPLSGVWQPEAIGDHLADEAVFFVIARLHLEQRIAAYGAVSIVAQSRRSQKEKSPQDRYTLFRVQRLAKEMSLP